MRRYTAICLLSLLSGCGLDVASSATTAAASKAEEIKQAEASSQKSAPPVKSLLTAPDVARALNVSKAQAYQLIRRKELRSFSVGKLVRVRREDLDAFIQEHLVG